jgi:hypothetical protein
MNGKGPGWYILKTWFEREKLGPKGEHLMYRSGVALVHGKSYDDARAKAMKEFNLSLQQLSERKDAVFYKVYDDPGTGVNSRQQ